ncbi:MAG: hypothetical protein LBN08_04360 [Lactobacillales bacterium]|jgi:NADH:ubiquinone oxidoreductase subunit 2 (subunit N)|nr:hypothetical protein [Lactobacillales bacterium]
MDLSLVINILIIILNILLVIRVTQYYLKTKTTLSLAGLIASSAWLVFNVVDQLIFRKGIDNPLSGIDGNVIWKIVLILLPAVVAIIFGKLYEKYNGKDKLYYAILILAGLAVLGIFLGQVQIPAGL